jgi:plasmid stability protein
MEQKEVSMPALTVKNIPEDLYEKLKLVADSHHRSLNSEILHCLETVLMPQKVSPTERIRLAREVRPRISAEAIGREEILQAIAEGRP